MSKIGVAIGRFQVHKLHAGHKYLLDNILKENDELVILVGTSDAKMTKRNPLSYELRESMIHEDYPGVRIFEIKDNPSNEIWSQNVDRILRENFPDDLVRLYGSRDSFYGAYSGENHIVIIPELSGYSGTSIRNGAVTPGCMESFRMGIIHAQKNRFPTSYQTVDIGLVKWDTKEILLGRKKNDLPGQWRLPGGFVDPQDESLVGAASRELSEEVGKILTHEFEQIGSYRIDDHRYKGEEDKIMTALFLTYYMGGEPVASDDLAEIKWFPLSTRKDMVIETHQKIFQAIVDRVAKDSLK